MSTHICWKKKMEDWENVLYFYQVPTFCLFVCLYLHKYLHKYFIFFLIIFRTEITLRYRIKVGFRSVTVILWTGYLQINLQKGEIIGIKIKLNA